MQNTAIKLSTLLETEIKIFRSIRKKLFTSNSSDINCLMMVSILDQTEIFCFSKPLSMIFLFHKDYKPWLYQLHDHILNLDITYQAYLQYHYNIRCNTFSRSVRLKTMYQQCTNFFKILLVLYIAVPYIVLNV